MADPLDRAIRQVVERNQTCSGCGGCALVSDRIEMRVDAAGNLRPNLLGTATPVQSRIEARKFKRICPGRRSVASQLDSSQGRYHPIFGSYVSAWEAWAADEEVRFAGSSGGAITALSLWLESEGHSTGTVCMTGGTEDPRSSEATVARGKRQALDSAGSRYGPGSVLSLHASNPDMTLVGKPCEVTAFQQVREINGDEKRPPTLSFFCAGVPSQRATDTLVARLGVAAADVQDLRYRGQGWPGQFKVTTYAGEQHALSYEEAWGRHLGRDLQWRCKLCPDGTGGSADISVGDYWEATAEGYPEFGDRPGRSVCIARTSRGHDWLMQAVAQGVITARPLDLDKVARVQPLQVERKQSLVYRLIARAVVFRGIPRFQGYHLTRDSTRHPIAIARAFVGTLRRSRPSRTLRRSNATQAASGAEL